MTNGDVTSNFRNARIKGPLLPPEGLSTTALHAMRRAGFGERVECTRWGYGVMRRTKAELVEGGWMVECATPKGKKRFLELTEKGKRLLHTVAAYYNEVQAAQAQYTREKDREERIRNAAPMLLKALKRIEDQTHDEDTRSYARAVLTSIEELNQAAVQEEKKS